MSPPKFLQSEEHGAILDVIDELRTLGISHFIDLPQIIVCGDQSSGKTSVLEALSGIPFPRKDNLCTRFATEVVLRRGTSETINVSIVPGPSLAGGENHSTIDFKKFDVGLGETEAIIAEAGEAIGLEKNSKNFSSDILRFEVSGPTQPQLMLVDLPGLFQAGNKAQSIEDQKAVNNLVLSYMKRERSIILAVVSAKNDFANQIVTKHARDFDPKGLRTLGVITKPDTLHAGSESEKAYFELAENKDVYLRHGWHMLKNLDYDTRKLSTKERDDAEQVFFEEGIWKSLPRSQVGISSLRPRLSALLRDQILNELPKLVEEIKAGVQECKRDLEKLGESRVDRRATG